MLHSLRLKVPPPIVALLCGLAAWYGAAWQPSWSWASVLGTQGPAWWLIVPLLALGFGLELFALGNFLRAKTTANPLQPSKAERIVITGPYRYTRNPMYLGLAISLTAWSLYVANFFALLFAPIAFVLYITEFQIKGEEAALLAKFGPTYADYLERVRRWL